MRTVDYSEILNGTAALSGMGAAEIGVGELVLFRQFHDRRLQVAWEIHGWPECKRVEQRTFRALWNSVTTYPAGAERYDVPTALYYQSLQAGNLNNPPSIAGAENSTWWAVSLTQYSAQLWQTLTDYVVGQQVQNPGDLNFYQCFSAHTSGASFDPTKFGLLTPFDRYVDYDQVNDDGTLQTPVGDFLFATDVDPRVTTKQVDLPFDLLSDGAHFTELKHGVSFVWLTFRTRRPVLMGDAYDQTLAYQAGQQIYYVGLGTTILPGKGNFFIANQATVAGQSPEIAPTKWDVVQIPYIFRGYLITGGYVDWLTGDGQGDKAARYEEQALESLENEADKLQRQSGQVRRLTWRN